MTLEVASCACHKKHPLLLILKVLPLSPCRLYPCKNYTTCYVPPVYTYPLPK